MPEELTNSEILRPKKLHGGRMVPVLLVIGIVILVGIVIFLIFTIFPTNRGRADWQAVFLTNGQIYFGRITKENSKSIVLQDVYYLQMQQAPPIEESESKEAQQRISVIRLGDAEVYGPENEMLINWSHVLFIEKLRKDSQVVATIEQSRK